MWIFIAVQLRAATVLTVSAFWEVQDPNLTMYCMQAMPPATPPKRGMTETATFSTPSAQLFDTNPLYDDVNERALWSPFNSSFSSDYCAFGGAAAGKPRRNPELAARHAAAAARHAAAAARHANAAAKFAGLRVRSPPKDGRRCSHAVQGPLCESCLPSSVRCKLMASSWAKGNAEQGCVEVMLEDRHCSHTSIERKEMAETP